MRERVIPSEYPGASFIGEDEVNAVTRVARSRNLFRYYGFGQPDEVAAYEREWAAHVGVAHALAVNSGTSALFCSLVAAGVRTGDEVIVPAFAWASVPNAVLQLGAVPVVVDVDRSLTIDVDAVERAITSRTVAVLPVHMRGTSCAMDVLIACAREHGLMIVEDACQAAGVTFQGRPVGSFGCAAAFSTQFAKLVCTGEGGVVVTDDRTRYEAALDAHDPASAFRRGAPLSEYPAMNLRCTELQAAVGRVQLRRLPELIARTTAHAARISQVVSTLPDVELRSKHDATGDNGTSVVFFATSAESARNYLEELAEAGVPASGLYAPRTPDLHVASYWRPVQAALSRLGRDAGSFDASLDLLGRAVQIDVHPKYEPEDVDAVCRALEHAGARTRARLDRRAPRLTLAEPARIPPGFDGD